MTDELKTRRDLLNLAAVGGAGIVIAAANVAEADEKAKEGNK